MKYMGDVIVMSYKGKYVCPNSKPKWPLFILVGMLLAGCVWGINSLFLGNSSDSKELNQSGPVEISIPETLEQNIQITEETKLPTEPEPVIYTATIGAMGDLLMHKPLFDAGYNAEVYQQGSYNFDSIFKYMKDDISTLDYAVANLETTLAGKDNGYLYSGYPSFNCPDELVESVKNAGFDMLLTANNHSYDTNMVGFKRTINVIDEHGLQALGTYSSADAKKWSIENINNINIGMVCYTYATDCTTDGRPILNGGLAMKEPGLCNYFTYTNVEKFYSEAESYLTEMKEAGADATIIFIHWGEEYQLTSNSHQQKIAQKLCDMGFDVILGGHPHVVQPVDLLESTVDPNHKTICVYSMGNAVSNQRQGALSAISTAHTEDGILCSVTFTKPEGEAAYVSDFSIVPTWVNMFTNNNGRREYNILPLHRSKMDSWQEDFSLSDSTYSKVQKSFDRTMTIVGSGYEKIQTHLNYSIAE